ncbi:MAG: type II toxin-antitoxin system ParD family antitoxin [Isosphaeraceae bacterium]
MTIQLPSARGQFVRSLIEGGRYPTEEAVIDEALRLLEEHDEAAKLTELRQDIAAGIAQAQRGELAPFDPHSTLARVRASQAAATGQS